MEQENLELGYLQSDKIGKVLAKGLATLFEQQPKFPVDYLAKWLLNYSVSQQNEQQLNEEQEKKQELQKEHKEEQERVAQEQEQQNVAQEEDTKIDEQFREKIVQHEYHNELIIDEFPEFLEQRKKLTGCYVGKLDFSVKEVNDDEEDEQAHLNKEDGVKVINYIGYSQSQQQLMTGKTLALEQGVTGDVFKEKEQEEANPENPDEEIVPQPNYVYIPDLVKEKRMHYFRLPKLGAYLATPLIYNSCLSESSFEAALEERQRYKIEKEEKEKEKEQKELEYQERLKELEEAQEDTTELQQQYEAEKAEFVEPEEAAFLTEKQEYVVCCDTMGQDQEIKKEDIEYLETFTNLFAKSWEDRERELLSYDVDRQLQYLDSLPAKPSDLVEQFLEQEDQAAQDKEGNFAELKETNEKEFNYEYDCVKLEKVREQLTDKTNQEYFLQLKDVRVIKFPGILQNILYLLGYKREEINLPNTHCLNWKLVRSRLLNDQFFEKVLNFNLKGSKPAQVPPYAFVNRISDKIAKYEQEQVDLYNIIYGRLLQWLRYTCVLRKSDIEIRREKIQQRRLDREQKIEENERITTQKEQELEEKLAELTEEEKEGFNQEEWSNEFDEKLPLHVIVDEVQDEEDNDCEFFE